MKNDLKFIKKELAVLKTDPAKSYLKHVLSPLEQSILSHNFQPFRFRLDGVFIYLSGWACKQILNTVIVPKIKLVNHLIDKDKKSKGIPFKLRETFDNPKIILALHPRLRNKLCRLELYSLFAIMQKGRDYFTNEQKFGKTAMKTLDGLFAKYGCSNLFL